MGLRLGFHYHVPALSGDGGDEGIYMPGYQGRFVDSLAAHCQQVRCFLHAPLPEERALMDYRLHAANVSLVHLGPHVSVPRRLLGARRLGRRVRDRCEGLDALILRGPSPLLPGLAGAAAELPLVLLLVGDLVAGIGDLRQPPWRREAIRLVNRLNRWRQNRLARHCLTLVNSRRLYEQLRPLVPHLHEIRTTTLTEKDFFRRADTCASPPYRLLYTGRMDRSKGLLEMVAALAELVSRGQDVVLDLVGWPQNNDPILDELMRLAQDQGVAQRVVYHGYKPVGPELFAFYEKADIYVIASTHEGFPRTIWEAMAHSLPVVATRVGSIPDYVRGAAELGEPRNAGQLAAAIQGLIGNSNLRRKLIAKGLGLAAENTLEAQVAKMVATIKEWLRDHDHE